MYPAGGRPRSQRCSYSLKASRPATQGDLKSGKAEGPVQRPPGRRSLLAEDISLPPLPRPPADERGPHTGAGSASTAHQIQTSIHRNTLPGAPGVVCGHCVTRQVDTYNHSTKGLVRKDKAGTGRGRGPQSAGYRMEMGPDGRGQVELQNGAWIRTSFSLW